MLKNDLWWFSVHVPMEKTSTLGMLQGGINMPCKWDYLRKYQKGKIIAVIWEGFGRVQACSACPRACQEAGFTVLGKPLVFSIPMELAGWEWGTLKHPRLTVHTLGHFYGIFIYLCRLLPAFGYFQSSGSWSGWMLPVFSLIFMEKMAARGLPLQFLLIALSNKG